MLTSSRDTSRIVLLSCGLLMYCLLLSSCSNVRNPQTPSVSDSIKIDEIPAYAQRLMDAYPQCNMRYEDCCIIVNDSVTIIYDDHAQKSFTEKLDNCDIEDVFSMIYDTINSTPSYLNDAGRGRNELLFKTMYGHSGQEVRKNLVPVEWFGQKILFTKVNNAAQQLELVAQELSRYPEFHKYLTGASTFYWRSVRGANRMSAHSYGIAIDINTKYSNYWLWANPHSAETDSITYQNQIPLEIVRIFEKHGFIWGGRWYHYDTMHFEYRPEILR